jgi:hypothetical protein
MRRNNKAVEKFSYLEKKYFHILQKHFITVLDRPLGLQEVEAP